MRLRFFFMVGGWAAVTLIPSCAADRLQDINAALRQGRYIEVETLANSALEEPGLDRLVQSRIYIARGLARQAQGQADSALTDFTQGLSANELPIAERATALFDRGVTLDSLGHFDDAISDYNAVLAITPGASNAFNNRANIYRRQGRLEEARRDYLAALTGDPVHAQYPYYGLGQIAEAQGNAAAARDFYARAVAADPNYQLAVDRLRALGTAAWTPVDPGAIVLRPPSAAAAIVLHPPHSDTVAEAVTESRAAELHPPSRRASPKPGVASQEGAVLRPAVVESQGSFQTATRGTLVQLGAWRSEAEARAGWAHARAKAGNLLDGLAPVIMTADLPRRGRYYRLRVAPQESVSQFCKVLVAKDLACFPARD